MKLASCSVARPTERRPAAWAIPAGGWARAPALPTPGRRKTSRFVGHELSVQVLNPGRSCRPRCARPACTLDRTHRRSPRSQGRSGQDALAGIAAQLDGHGSHVDLVVHRISIRRPAHFPTAPPEARDERLKLGRVDIGRRGDDPCPGTCGVPVPGFRGEAQLLSPTNWVSTPARRPASRNHPGWAVHFEQWLPPGRRP